MSQKTWIRSIAFAAPLCLAAFTGCDPQHDPSCFCTLEMRVNVCAQGKYEGMDSVTYRREHGNGVLDTIPFGFDHCFEELPGKQRILVYKGGAKIDSSAWFTLGKVDCCHGEAKTVVF